MPKITYTLTDALGQTITRKSDREYLYVLYRILETADGRRFRNFPGNTSSTTYSFTVDAQVTPKLAAVKARPVYREGCRVVSAHAEPTQFGLALGLKAITL